MTDRATSEAPPTPVLEVGGTHVTAALVDTASGLPVAASVVRESLESDGGADAILDTLAATALRLGEAPGPRGRTWGVAMPGPFDYATGRGRFRGVDKFEALHGVDVGAGLRERLGPAAGVLRFLNDADAFALGEHRAGAAAGIERAVCLTLGTGVGSCFLDQGRPVHHGPKVPPAGHVHRLRIGEHALEDVVSRRAIRARYAALAGHGAADVLPDVREIAARARQHDPSAVRAIGDSFRALGQALALWLRQFEASAVVVGGSISESWDLIADAFSTAWTEEAFGPSGPPVLLRARRPVDAPLIGAAHWAIEAMEPRPTR